MSNTIYVYAYLFMKLCSSDLGKVIIEFIDSRSDYCKTVYKNLQSCRLLYTGLNQIPCKMKGGGYND